MIGILLWVLAVVGVIALALGAGVLIHGFNQDYQQRNVDRALKAYREKYGATATYDADGSGWRPYPGHAKTASEADVKALWKRVKQLEAEVRPKTTKKSNNKEKTK